MRLVAFAGPKGSGKDTAAKYLLARNSVIKANLFTQINFADPLKSACGIIFGLTQAEMYDPMLKEVQLDRWPFLTPRQIMQNVANLFRTMYAPDIWVKAWEKKVKVTKADCIVITDLRHIEEVERVRAFQGKIIYVHNPDVEKARHEGIKNGDPLWSDSSEAQTEYIRSIADVEIENDGRDLQGLYTNVHVAFLKAMGDWAQWPQEAGKEGLQL